MAEPPEYDSAAVISDLLREKSLAEIYSASRRIPARPTNRVAGAFAAVISALVIANSANTTSAVDQTATLASTIFNTSISLLGFLLAGFSFFATVADKSLFCQMAIRPHKASGLSYLKYNMFLFMRIFVEYLAGSLVSFVVMTSLSPGATFRTFALSASNPHASTSSTAGLWCFAVFYGVLFGSFIYLLMQLKTFIFNIYHVVMTSIAWVIHDRSQDLSQEPNNAQADGDPPAHESVATVDRD